MAASELCFLSAVAMARMLRERQISCRELMEAHVDRIALVNPKINAIVTLVAEQAMEAAMAADFAEGRGPLYGLPVAHKDLHETRGIRTTYGSPIYSAHVPSRDAVFIKRIKRAGAITIGKTNTPEFGAGSQTFNPVFGATKNPYDLTKTCGGSSGGAAAGLAAGMFPIADGSDMGGSLRNPASFCNVVGMRPSPGRVPNASGWMDLSVAGPMARTVADAALLFSVMADEQQRPLERDLKGVRVAWACNIPGVIFEPAVINVVAQQRKTFEELGCVVEDAAPDFSGANEIFKTLRAFIFELAHAEHYRLHRHLLKEAIVAEVERGQMLTGPQVGQAALQRSALQARIRLFMEKYEYFILPTVQTVPFDVAIPFPESINGIKMESYIDWMRSCFYVTVAGNPAISVPCGFTPEGLPVGVQIVGRHGADHSVLQLAYAFEQATGFGKYRPPD